MKMYVIMNAVGNIVGVYSSKTKMHRRIDELGKDLTWSEWIVDKDYTEDDLYYQ